MAAKKKAEGDTLIVNNIEAYLASFDAPLGYELSRVRALIAEGRPPAEPEPTE